MMSADGWSEVGDALREKSEADAGIASRIRKSADGLYPENSGQMIDGMHGMYMRDAMAVMDQSDLYQNMSAVVDEVAQLIYHARTQLDEIDRAANEEIERLKAAAQGGGIGASLRLNAVVADIAAVITKARAAAEALSASIAAEIGVQVGRVGAHGKTEPLSNRDTGRQINPADFRSLGGGGNPRDGLPTGLIGQLPQTPEGDRPLDESGSAPAPPPRDRPLDATQPPTEEPKTGASAHQNANAGKEPVVDRPLDGSPPQLSPLNQLAPRTPTSTTAPSLPMSSSPSGGLNFPSTGMPSTGMATGTPSAGSLSSGMSNPVGGLPSAPTSAVPPATPNDFSRGLSAGLGGSGGGAPLLPAPVSSPPPTQAASTTGAVAGSPPAVMPAAGAAAGMAAPVSASAPPPVGGAVIPPAAAGPLPPFTSDLPRNAPPVTPAAGPPSAAPPSALPPPAASPPVAPLPPGVVGSGVGAAAVGAGVGVRSSAPDPLLEGASRLVYELMHASRLYAAIDWCVGVFKTPSGPQTVVVSSEGAGYIPPGVFLPRSVRLLFSDPGLSDAFRARWFAWVNPAQTMLAYAASCTELDPNLELYAVAVSTDQGGSALPARDAGVPHYEDCSLLVSPISADASAPTLDATRMHRLEALDRAEYARLTRTPDRSESWTTTEGAVRVALSRASAMLGFSIPPVIRQITQILENGESVTDNHWNDLELVRVNAILDSASQRPGRTLESDGASPYARAYHNLARLAELLALWRGNDPQHAEIAYTAAQITTEPGLWPTGGE
jgi:hypothetical protein